MGRRGIFVRDAADRITSDSQTRRGGKGGSCFLGSPLSEKRMQVLFLWHRDLQVTDNCLTLFLVGCCELSTAVGTSSWSKWLPSTRAINLGAIPITTPGGGVGGFAPPPLCTIGSQGVDLRLFTISLWWDSNPWQLILQLNLTLSAASVKSWLGTAGRPWMQSCAPILCNRDRSDESLCQRGPSFRDALRAKRSLRPLQHPQCPSCTQIQWQDEEGGCPTAAIWQVQWTRRHYGSILHFTLWFTHHVIVMQLSSGFPDDSQL